MNEDDFDFFSADESNDETEVNVTETEQVEETEEVAAEETVEETVEETTETETEAPKQEAETPKTVPLSALQQEREKARLRQAEIERLQQQIAEAEAAKQQGTRPDAYDDPDGFASYVEAQVAAQVQATLQRREQERQQQAFDDARDRALAEHGEEFVSQLGDWVDDYARTVDPHVGAKAIASPDPVQFVIDLQKRHTAFEQFNADPDEYVRQRALELGLVNAAPAAATANKTTAKKSVGPKSVANASSRIHEGDLNDGFDDIFR